MMSVEEFLKHLPCCAKCGEVFPALCGPDGTIGVSQVRTANGRRQVVDVKLYHVACAPKRPDGTPYAPGTINYEVWK